MLIQVRGLPWAVESNQAGVWITFWLMTMADPSAQLLTYSPVGWANRFVCDPKNVVHEESSVLKTKVANPSHSTFTNRTWRDDRSENMIFLQCSGGLSRRKKLWKHTSTGFESASLTCKPSVLTLQHSVLNSLTRATLITHSRVLSCSWGFISLAS